MNHTFLTSALAVLLLSSTVFAEPVVGDVVTKQRYPWSGPVDIERSVSGAETDTTYNFVMTVADADTGELYAVS